MIMMMKFQKNEKSEVMSQVQERNLEMTVCPNCGVGLSFEEEDDDDDEISNDNEEVSEK